MTFDSKASNVKVHCTFSGDAIHPWDTGTRVSELQVLLNACGYSLRVDGDFGSLTEAAIRAFQQQHELRVDGVVGAIMWTALEANIRPGARMLRVGHIGADVHGLQELLHHHGYSVQKDGCFDATTKRAVMQFQRKRQLKDDGIVDVTTWNQLQACPVSDKSKLGRSKLGKSNLAMSFPNLKKRIDSGKWW